MKFISKSSNLLIVLRPGLSAQPLTGTPAKPTVSVRFKDGVADVQSDELVQMMLAHPGFSQDFISAEGAQDPYANSRQPSEPAHVLTDLQFGTPVSRKVVGGKQPALPVEMQKLVTNMAAEMAKQMLPSMLKELVTAHAATTKAGKPKGKPGRKPKVKAESPVQSIPDPIETPAAVEAVA